MPRTTPSTSQIGGGAHTASFHLGPLSMEWSGDSLRWLSWHGVEMLRGVSFPIRDANWGTKYISKVKEETLRDVDAVWINFDFITLDGGFRGAFSMDADSSGRVTMDLFLVSQRRQTICRAGFNLLHPIRGLAGQSLEVTRSRGTTFETKFPLLVSPAQPVFDLNGLRYEIDGCAVVIKMSGDVFEMEDQRNWSDASFKTYCRPLALPFPYEVAQDEIINQRIEISCSGMKPYIEKVADFGPSGWSVAQMEEEMPSAGLAVERDWGCKLPNKLDDIRLVVRVDLNEEAFDVSPDGAGPLDLELITSDNLDEARAQLFDLASRLSVANIAAEHILALPKSYLKSYQPDGVWPDGASPNEVMIAARVAFPNSRIGGGMLTNFTEFNRCPPDPALLDYISHGSSAIVHAADDTSVFQTIEALPQIFASAQALVSHTPYRLGLVSIGMRTNPYGGEMVDLHDGNRHTMTTNDPRAKCLSGAAWLVAAMAATKGFGIQLMTMGAPSGPFGITDRQSGLLRPSFHVISQLHFMRGMRRADLKFDNAEVHVVAAYSKGEIRAIASNCGQRETVLRPPPGARGTILDSSTQKKAEVDGGWTEKASHALSNELKLKPYATAFLRFPWTEGITQ